MEALLQKIALTQIKWAGPILTRLLISECKGVAGVFESSDDFLLSIPKVTQKMVDSIRDPYIFERAEQEMNFISRNGVTPIFYLDKEFPKRLDFCPDAPLLLYAKGNLNLNNKRIVALVGTRSSTAYGREMCERIIKDLAPYNPLIVSGLAMGIDCAAHKAALENNLQTVGVLAHGVDSVYPPSSRVIASKMMSNGGVLSEFFSGTIPSRENFPIRNRIIAGMCDAVIVIESKQRGGSIITADLAYGYNKEVFAVPGKASDKLSQGCNDLIKFQKAVMVTSGADVARELNWSAPDMKNKQVELFIDLDKNQKKTLGLLRSSGTQIGFDELSITLNINSSDLSKVLLELEFEGLVRALPGKVFEAS